MMNRYFFTKLLNCHANLPCTDDGSWWLQASPTEFLIKTLLMRFYCEQFNEENHATQDMILVTVLVFKLMMSLCSTQNESWQKMKATGRKLSTMGLFRTLFRTFPRCPLATHFV